jgi:hypothetical protein
MKTAVSWDIAPSIFCKTRRFGGRYLLNHRGGKHRRARNVSSNQQLKQAAKRRYLYEKDRMGILGSLLPAL